MPETNLRVVNGCLKKGVLSGFEGKLSFKLMEIMSCISQYLYNGGKMRIIVK